MMDLVVAVAIGVLSIVFLGSLIALTIICRQKYCAKPQGDEKPILKYTRDHSDIPGSFENSGHTSGIADEQQMGDTVMQLSPSIEKYLKDYNWVYDATGLVQHCLAILKICHQVTDKLSAMSFTPKHGNQALMDEVSDATRRVMPRVDDLVRTMYASGSVRGARNAPRLSGPNLIVPFAPLLEARAAALVLALSSVAIAFKAAYPRARADSAWLKSALGEMENHLEALRLASHHVEQSQREKVELVVPGGSPSTIHEDPTDVETRLEPVQSTSDSCQSQGNSSSAPPADPSNTKQGIPSIRPPPPPPTTSKTNPSEKTILPSIDTRQSSQQVTV